MWWRGDRLEMSITIIWQTKMRSNRDEGQKCVVCLNMIRPRSVAIRDIQSNDRKMYYHPECFRENRPHNTEEIYDFWNNLWRREDG
jgi:hypothetical protein